MIPRLHERTHRLHDPLEDALRRLVSPNEGLSEYTAHRIAHQPGAVSTDTAHRLELIARRLHAIQQDLDSTAAHLVQPRVAAAPTAARHTAHRSP